MNLKQLIKFGLENSSDPVIKNPVLRSALEKPRSMDQAALSDDVVPGRLKDELEGKFNPDQETYEEYLQRINLERPFNMNQGGRIAFDGGGSPLQRLRQEIVDSMRPYAPGDVTEDQLQLVVKDITLDMTAEQAQASAKANFIKLFGMAEGGRAGYNDGQLVTPSVDGSRPGYGGNQIKAPVKLSAKEVKNIRNGLPKGINLISSGPKHNKNWYYVLDFYPGGGFEKSKKPIRYSPMQATEKNLEYLLDEQEKLQKKYYKNRLSNEDFLKLRMNDENIQLTRSEFAKKLNKLGYKTQLDNKWTESIVNNTQKRLDLNNKWFAKGRTLKEARDVIKELAPNSKQIFERINKITDSKLKLDALRKEAQNIVRTEGRLKTWGNFSAGPSREGKLWNNFYEAVKSGDRMEIKGTFEGKSLRFRKNWPRNDKGQINWNKLDSKTKKPAWKSVEFTDTKVPDKNNPGKFKKTTFTFDNLKTQVDNAFTPGHFARSTSAYAAQKELAGKNIMVKGKSVNLNQYIARQNIIKKYQIDNPGKIPPEDFIQRNMRAYSPTQVHHWGEGGIGADPYRTQLTTRAANQAVAQSEATYKAALRKAGNDTVKIKAAKDNFIKSIEDISSKHGGITYTVDQKVIGNKPTEKGIHKFLKDDLKNKNFSKTFSNTFKDLGPRSVAQLAKTHGCKTFSEGGSIISCLKKKFNANPEKFLQKSAPLAKNNVNLFKWFKNGRKIARGTGIALAWEAAFAPIIAGWGALEGQSGQRILNDIAYGIPFVGETEKEEWMKYAGGDELAYKMKQMGELEEQELPYLDQQLEKARKQSAPTREKMPNYVSPKEQYILDDIKEKELKLQGLYNTPEFWEGPAGAYYNEPAIKKAYDLEQKTTAQIAADTAERKKDTFNKLREMKIIADKNWQSQNLYAGGGIAGIRRPNAIPPESGPTPQGLPSMYNRVRRI